MCHDIKTIYLEKKNFNADYLKKHVKNKLLIKTQQRFKNSEETNKIALSPNDNK